MLPRSAKLIILHTCYALLYCLGIFRLINSRRTHGLIITYHNILADKLFDDRLHLGVSHSVSNFERHLALIKTYLQPTLDFESQNPKNCVITFDDGYKNNLLAAAILEKHGMHGVFFVPIKPLVDGRTLVIDAVLLWFSYVPPGVYSLPYAEIVLDEGNRNSHYAKFYEWLLANPMCWNEIPALLENIFAYNKLGISGELKQTRFTPMNLEDINLLIDAGHAIGCHSWDHRPLAILDDVAIHEDFARCEKFRQMFGLLNIYSYPFGGSAEVDGRAIQQCRAAGYRGAVLNYSGQRDHETAFTRRRDSLPNNLPTHVLAAKLSGFEAWLKSLTKSRN